MEHAPVLIPTLNRYDHFKRCLESLERCTGADMTVVYIGLDYPPSEKYIEGWRKIDRYLTEKELNNSFAKLIVKRRNHNLGIGNKNSNLNVLLSEIPESVTCYILTEDDNEFSPNFLDFMNQTLDIYKDNPKVFSVCGYVQPQYEVKNRELLFIYDNSAWGLGRWTNRETPDMRYVTSKLSSPKNMLKVYLRYPALFHCIFDMIKRNTEYGDTMFTLKCICEDMYQVRPSSSLVRNTGDDGSGQHCVKDGRFSSQAISTENKYFLSGYCEPTRTKVLDRMVFLNMSSSLWRVRFRNTIIIVRKLLKYWLSNIKHNRKEG